MNLSGLLSALDQAAEYNQLKRVLLSRDEAGPLMLRQSARPAVLAKIFLDQTSPILLLTGKVEAVPRWQEALKSWLPDQYSVLRFPEPTPLPFERGPWSNRSRMGRLEVLRRLVEIDHPLLPAETPPFLIVSSARAMLQKTMPKRQFIGSTRVLKTGQLVDLDSLINTWRATGYESVSVVDRQGQFSKRGGILDIFPVGSLVPQRIELFGDEIDTIRPFDPATQRSAGIGPIVGSNMGQDHGSNIGSMKANYVVIPPARELLPKDAVQVGQHLRKQTSHLAADIPGWRDDIDELIKGRPSDHLEYYLAMAYADPSTLLDYCPDNTIIVVDDLDDFEQGALDLHLHARQVANEQDGLPSVNFHPLFSWEEMAQSLKNRGYLNLGSDNSMESSAGIDLNGLFRDGPRFGGQVRPFVRHLQIAEASNERTVIVSQQAERLAELWQENRKQFTEIGDSALIQVADSQTSFPREGQISFVQGSLLSGFILKIGEDSASKTNGSPITVNLMTDAEIFGWSRPAPKRRVRPRPAAPESFYADIQPGDFIVHFDFGIGRFHGLVIRSVGGTKREYLRIDYFRGDVLYVPVHHADRLSRWLGPDDRLPRLHRLGEKRWQTTKQKASKAVNELASELLNLYAARETVAGHAFSADTQWQRELEASFPYTETEDQLLAISDVKDDMERPYPMDRLICGDVGYGKTEVALRAAFKAVMGGKQVAMLVPTTVLAQQHFTTFRERLKPFPVVVEMLSRFRTASQQEDIIKRLRNGQVDIVIGTHRLLSDDVAFKDLGLLFIDEEQRFGVAHKEKLKQFRTEVDVLTMTATPIPRTLYMGLTGVRDISQIDTAPADRLPVQNYVGESDDAIIRRAIIREIDRGGQIFYVHNRIQTIDNMRLKLFQLVPEATLAVGHGQMSERELEEIMFRFVEGEIDILLSTSIIESGLDIPNANTLIVDRADQFGLAQLYQLRGRVGRGVRRAYAYFLHPPWEQLTNDAKSRLEVITSQTELGAGYTIAMRDLEIRGAGDLLGSRQSGHIADIGFDLYTRMLSQAVKTQKAEKDGDSKSFILPATVTIDLPLAAYVPVDYIPDASLRLRLYRRMAILSELESIDEMAAELADRFGPIPDPIDNLLYQLRVKVLAQRAGIPAVATENGQVQIRLPSVVGNGGLRLQRYLGGKAKVSRNSIWLGRGLSPHEWQVALVQILEKFEEFEIKPEPTVSNKDNG